MTEIFWLVLGFVTGSIFPTWRLKGDMSWKQVLLRLLRGDGTSD